MPPTRDETEPRRPSKVEDMTFHHVGVAVHDMERALDYYTGTFGFRQLSAPIEVPSQHVKVCFLEAAPGVRIELVEGLGDASPVKEILSRTGAGTYHMCFEVGDLDATTRALRRRGFHRLRRFEQPVPGGRQRFAFLLTPDRQLFELCEAEGKTP